LTESSSSAAGAAVAAPRVRRRLILAIFALLLAACVIAGLSAMAASNAEAWATHTIVVRERAAELLGAVTEAETAERDDILTGQAFYRSDYDAAKRRIPVLQNELMRLTADKAQQQVRLKALVATINTRLAWLDHTQALVQAGQVDDAVRRIKAGGGRRETQSIQARVKDFVAVEQQFYDQRRAWADAQRIGSFSAILVSILAAVGLAFLAGDSTRRYRRALERNNLALQREIAERERTEAQLRQVQKVEALGRLTGGVAHDFNNVLAIIIGNLDLALKRVTEDRARRMMENAMEGAQRAASLTQRLLAFSRQQPLEPKPTDLNRCVTETSNLLHRVLGETITIETVLGAGAWRAMVDPNQLDSAILNLAINARDAMPEGGKLTLETSNTYLDESYADDHEEVAPGQYVLLAITDTGLGMTPETLAKAFDPFFTTKPVGSGTGLGLSQVYGFIKQSGGHVKLYSEPGVGTTVKLYLPRSLAEGDVTTEAAPLPKREVTGLSVLVVEDAAAVRAFAAEALEHLGYAVHQADAAETALKLLRDGTAPDLLLTDVVMPGVNGRKLAEEAVRIRTGLRVLYMTGYTRNAIVHNGVLDTGTHLLTKPFTVAQLDRALRAVFDSADP
jgi:signal transduction histidine kinase